MAQSPPAAGTRPAVQGPANPRPESLGPARLEPPTRAPASCPTPPGPASQWLARRGRLGLQAARLPLLASARPRRRGRQSQRRAAPSSARRLSAGGLPIRDPRARARTPQARPIHGQMLRVRTLAGLMPAGPALVRSPLQVRTLPVPPALVWVVRGHRNRARTRRAALPIAVRRSGASPRIARPQIVGPRRPRRRLRPRRHAFRHRQVRRQTAVDRPASLAAQVLAPSNAPPIRNARLREARRIREPGHHGQRRPATVRRRATAAGRTKSVRRTEPDPASNRGPQPGPNAESGARSLSTRRFPTMSCPRNFPERRERNCGPCPKRPPIWSHATW